MGPVELRLDFRHWRSQGRSPTRAPSRPGRLGEALPDSVTVSVSDESPWCLVHRSHEIDFVLHVELGDGEAAAIAGDALAGARIRPRRLFARQNAGANPRRNLRPDILFVHPCYLPRASKRRRGRPLRESSSAFHGGNTTAAGWLYTELYTVTRRETLHIGPTLTLLPSTSPQVSAVDYSRSLGRAGEESTRTAVPHGSSASNAGAFRERLSTTAG